MEQSWKELLNIEMDAFGEDLSDIVASTLTERELKKKFPTGLGAKRGKAFTIWTLNRVYFPVVYDGAEWVGSVSRNPDGKATPHLGV